MLLKFESEYERRFKPCLVVVLVLQQTAMRAGAMQHNTSNNDINYTRTEMNTTIHSTMPYYFAIAHDGL